MISPKICHCIHYRNMSKYVTVSTTNTWDTKYATVSNTWAIKDTVTSYFTKYTLCSATAYQCPPILMFKCQPWSKMCALAASLIILVTSCTYLEIWFDSGLHVPNDPCLTDSPWLLSCSSFSKRQKSSNSWVSHESRLSTPVMQHWDCKPAPVVVSSSLSRNWHPLQAAAILSSL